MAGPDIPFRGGGGGAHVMIFNAKVTIGSFEGRKLIYNKIISRKIYDDDNNIDMSRLNT